MDQTMALILTIIPILIILAMLLIWRQPADITGGVGLLAVVLIAVFFFDTTWNVIWRSTVAGLIKSFAVSLIVATSLLQMAFMQSTGALKRIIVFIKTISSSNRAVQIMLINIGFGTLMVAVGATPVSILPPIMLALGYSTYAAIALPAIGYDSLCTYALLGAPIVVFVDVANKFLTGNGAAPISLHEAGSIFWLFIPLVSTMIGFSMLWIVDKWKGVVKGFWPVITTGVVITLVSYFTNKLDNLVTLTGIFSGIAVIIAMVIYLKLSGKKVIDRSKLTEEDKEIERSMPLWKALTPWALLVIIILVLNIPPKFFNTLYREWTMPITGLAVDGPIKTRALWNAYTWILVSTILSAIFLLRSKVQLKQTFVLFGKRAVRPVLAAAVFFSIGEVMNTAGFGTQTKNMVQVLAQASQDFFHSAYSAASAFIGLLGGFITGSEASTIGMFGTYALKTANLLKASTPVAILICAALAFGGGLASVISPAKLQNAAAAIDKIGEENKVIRVAFVFSLILTTLTALATVIYLAAGVVK